MKSLEKSIGCADQPGTAVDVTYSPTDEDGDGMIFLRMRLGPWSVVAAPTPDAARQIAAALLDSADRYDEDERA